jgi:preprotein translocase subunit SecG
MLTGLIVLHVFVCILLTIVVLLQFGKGAEVGAVMGGGASQNVFSSSSKGNFFSKMTTVLAIVFMVNSVTLTIMQANKAKESIFDNEAPTVAPLNRDAQVLDATDSKAGANKANTQEDKK